MVQEALRRSGGAGFQTLPIHAFSSASKGMVGDQCKSVFMSMRILICDNTEQKRKVFEGLSKHFKLKDIGFPKSLLGCQYERTPQGIRMHQTEYIQELLARCDFVNCNPCKTPALADPTTSGGGARPTQLIKSGYSLESISGALGWLARNSRPDINFAWAKLAQNISNPDTETQWKRAGRILRYLKGRPSDGILWKRDHKEALYGYSDANWGGPEHKKSQTGFLYFYAGAPLTWGSIRQRCVALSTAESEIVALCAAAKHGMALNTTLGELGEKVLIPPNINVRVDNKAAITLAGTNVFSKGLRHVT